MVKGGGSLAKLSKSSSLTVIPTLRTKHFEEIKTFNKYAQCAKNSFGLDKYNFDF